MARGAWRVARGAWRVARALIMRFATDLRGRPSAPGRPSARPWKRPRTRKVRLLPLKVRLLTTADVGLRGIEGGAYRWAMASTCSAVTCRDSWPSDFIAAVRTCAHRAQRTQDEHLSPRALCHCVLPAACKVKAQRTEYKRNSHWSWRVRGRCVAVDSSAPAPAGPGAAPQAPMPDDDDDDEEDR